MTYLEQVEKVVGAAVSLSEVGKGSYRITLKEIQPYRNVVAYFNLNELPGCCGVSVSNHAVVGLNYRQKGLGSILNKMRQQIAWNQGYTVLLCTDRMDNEPQQKILSANRWQRLAVFTNRRTNNEVGIHVKHLEDSGVLIGSPIADYKKEM